MNNGIERDFDKDQNYKRLRAKPVYLFALRAVRNENAWDDETCEDIAYDLTMDAITALLIQEKKGNVIDNPYKYLLNSIKNALLKPKLIFYKSMSRSKQQLDLPGHLSFIDMHEVNAVAMMTNSFDLVDIRDVRNFIVHSNALTPQEATVSKLLTDGCNGKQIAEKLNLSESTVSRIVNMIQVKLGGKNP